MTSEPTEGAPASARVTGGRAISLFALAIVVVALIAVLAAAISVEDDEGESEEEHSSTGRVVFVVA